MSRGGVFTTRTAAAYCGIAESTLRNRLCAGTFPAAHKNGRKNAWFQDELDEWLAVNVAGVAA